MAKEKVLIVGGGFGGIKAALELADNPHISVTLLSDQASFRYYPTLYHTATGGRLNNSSIPLPVLFRGKGIKIIHAKATTLDRKAKTMATDTGEVVPFDTLILGLGVITNYFGIEGLQEFSFSIKSTEEAVRFKNHLHQQLLDERKPDLNYVIVGAGPTGIELAGALPQYLRSIMDNHGIKHRAIHVDLVEAAPRLLPRMPRDYGLMIARRLRKLGVKIYTKAAVQGLSADALTINGKPLSSHTVVWTAGVTNHPFFKENNFVLTQRGKVAVDVYLQAEDNIYVIGDNANTPYSGMAQTAIYDGSFIARNLIRKAEGKDLKPYKPKKPITVIPVGANWAATLWGKLRIYGLMATSMREAADLLGFHDYEPWPQAVGQWTTEFGGDEACARCLTAHTRS